MARMYGRVQGSRGVAHRLGGSRLETIAATWQGAVVVTLRVERTGRGKDLVETDYCNIRFSAWAGAGMHREIYDGPVNGEVFGPNGKLVAKVKRKRGPNRKLLGLAAIAGGVDKGRIKP